MTSTPIVLSGSDAAAPSHVSLTRLIWRLVFLGAFVISGFASLLALTVGLSYRMALWSLLVLPLFFVRRLRVNAVVVAYLSLTGAVVLSGFANGSAVREIVLFSRTLVFSFLMYALTQFAIHRKDVDHVLSLCVRLAMLQLPIVGIQWALYPHLPVSVKAHVHSLDIGSGTFNLKGDAGMSLFVTLVVLILLFHDRQVGKLKNRWLPLLWLSLTVLVANSEIMKPVLLIVWAVYLLRNPLKRRVVRAAVLLVVAFIGMWMAGILDALWHDFVVYLPNNVSFGASGEAAFLKGSYGRGAAVAYYLQRGLSLVGDGPARYYDPVSRAFSLGNRGHLFTFYSEVGLLGWLASVFVCFSIAFSDSRSWWHLRLHWVRVLAFLAIQALSYTTEIMNDISVFFAYCILLRVHDLVVLNVESAQLVGTEPTGTTCRSTSSQDAVA